MLWLYYFESLIVVSLRCYKLVNIFECTVSQLTEVDPSFIFNLPSRHRPVLEKCYDIDHVMKVGRDALSANLIIVNEMARS